MLTRYYLLWISCQIVAPYHAERTKSEGLRQVVIQEIQSTTHSDRYRAAAEEFACRVTGALGDRVDSIVLYGSAARGDAGPESDIDILVVGDDSRSLRDITGKIAFDLDCEGEFTFLISAFAIERDELLNLRLLGSPFVRNILREGHILYDNDTFVGIPDMTEGPSQEYISRQLELADEALDDANFLLSHDRYKLSANRAYYAMFYAAIAALMRSGGDLPRTHGGVRNQFGLHYVRTGIIDSELADTLQDTYELRRKSDYELFVSFTEDEIRQAVRNARAFVSAVRLALDLPR